MVRHSGRFGKVYVDGAAVATISAFTYDQTRKRIDVTCMGDTNTVEVQGLPAVKGDWSGFWDDTDTTPFTGSNKTTYCDMILYPDYTNNPEKYAYGPANLDMNMSTSVGGAVEFKGTWSAAGSWINTFGT